MTDDSDPFGPFQRFFDQFNPSRAASLPGMGFPLSPLGVPGAGTAADLSPEDSTKRTVKQLYNALAALSGTDTTAAGEPWQTYFDAFDIDASALGPEQFTAATLRTYRIWFFSLTQLLVESYTIGLVHQELVVEGHRSGTGTQEWLWGLPQSDREQLLQRCTDVPDDLVAEMQALRRRRDELLYTFGGWDEVTFDDSLADAKRSLEVLTALDERVTDGSPFPYAPTASDGADGETDSDDTDADSADGEDATDGA